MRAEGYMIEATLEGDTLTVVGKNKPARVALAGAEHGDGPVVVKRDQIERVDLKPAGMMTNGNLIVRTTDGRKYQLHFRKKQAEDFTRLHEALS